ncbi:MAG: DNA repair protein RecO [Flavobacteriales bacterium]|nr:DNA repair protein RecO [Flavobacteriales bacterium]
MLYNTRGLAIKYIKYSESSVIATIYTELFGMQSYFINGVRTQKAKIKINALQPLSILDLVVYHKDKKKLNRIKELRLNPFLSIPNSIYKTSLTLFLAEIIQKSIKEEEPNSNLFEFLIGSMRYLDMQESSFSNFHILFLVKLTRFLGFYPQVSSTNQNNFFDMENGIFLAKKEEHSHFMNLEESSLLSLLLTTSYDNQDKLKIETFKRKAFLLKMIDYYTVHLSFSQEIVSHKILEEALY